MEKCLTKLLIVDGNRKNRDRLKSVLQREYAVFEADSCESAIRILQQQKIAIVLLDLHLPPCSEEIATGVRVFDQIVQFYPGCCIIVMTEERDRKAVYEILQRGAYDFFEKPVDPDELQFALKRLVHLQKLKEENQELKQKLSNSNGTERIIGESTVIQHLEQLILSVANTCASVLITGESGTGKELVARAIHHHSSRKEKPFIVVNSSAIPDSLLESELFGYEKGAFTGAYGSKPGKFELANGGTVFLDEIGDMSTYLQGKILRAIENREIERLGGTKVLPLDVRIVSATNKNLLQLIREEKFREDLYYRLNVVNIFLPPLRQRREDIRLLANFFLNRYARRESKIIRGFTNPALEILETYNWPGNIRELENVVERGVILCNEPEIGVEHLPPEINGGQNPQQAEELDFANLVNNFKRLLIRRTLQETENNKAQAARKLGLNRTYFFKLLKELGIR